MAILRPVIGQVGLLVYRECRYGCWCATGEGACAPLCAEHGQPMLTGGGERDDDWEEVARVHRLGFAALFGHERGVMFLLSRLRRLLGFVVPTGNGGWEPGDHCPQPPRYFTEDEIAREADARGWTGERWPEPVDVD